jgi:putative radical SAM enzyme (TIGR03279 family)
MERDAMYIIEVYGPARRAGVLVGETLLSVNGEPVNDILDVRYHTYEPDLRLELRAPDGVARFVLLRHETGGDPGLLFENDLPGGGHTCQNNCIFCFIDQNPPGCRGSLYVKDDDARLSFLQGNYISLTNLTADDRERICRMRISPLGISVHTTDPALRKTMLRNERAGDCMGVMRRFADAGVRMNAQIVLCPGINDGAALERTLNDLQTLGAALISVSIVPVGLTKHRRGLKFLHPVTREDALAAIEASERYCNVWCSDEMLLKAGMPIPPAVFYDDFPQLENGVGMLALFQDDWMSAGADFVRPQARTARPYTIATGRAAAPMLTELLRPFPNVTVVPVENRFFGDTVNVAGLLTGGDLLHGLRGRKPDGRLLIPSNMLRRSPSCAPSAPLAAASRCFLDGMTVGELSEKLGVPVIPVEPDAESLWEVLTCEQ